MDDFFSAALEDELSDILQSSDIYSRKFFELASKEGIFDINNQGTSVFTIFVPPDVYVTDISDFHTFWNRHVIESLIVLDGSQSLMHIKTVSNIYYSIFSECDTFYIGGVQILTHNEKFGNCIIHEIVQSLPIIQFCAGDILQLPINVLSLDTYSLTLRDIEYVREEGSTFHVSFNSLLSRKTLGLSKHAWNGGETNISFQIPDVSEKESVNLWISLVSNRLGIVLISWLRPQNMVILPNVCLQKSPIVLDINPTRGKKGDALWINGMNFSPKVVRVIVGQKNSLIISCSSTLIKCVIPDSEFNGSCKIQVANANVFITSSQVFTYV